MTGAEAAGSYKWFELSAGGPVRGDMSLGIGPPAARSCDVPAMAQARAPRRGPRDHRGRSPDARTVVQAHLRRRRRGRVAFFVDPRRDTG